ncbi:hypothetical protein SAMN04488109_2166 [Chryseolinea serpens]|uniref:Uncharacterized protein n=1 Tax=Chryseolinea serpens TaxID=947013 RepID=A0A1M5NA01_9BACT|nr:hypothetical protein [Chryseolinea serpens]SHG85833.1 hypothetical protein SAMN04488109_2166 [Chryseolinea serpens]
MRLFPRNTSYFTTGMLLLMALLCTAQASVAQMVQTHRFERHQKMSDDYYNVIPLVDDGLALFRERDKYQNNNKVWELILLDTALQEKKTLELEVNTRNKMIGYEVTLGTLFLLYRTGETNKNDFEIIEINLKTWENVKHHFKPDLDFKLTHFIKAGDNFIFGGYVNNEPAVLLFELANSHVRVLPGFFQKDTELVDLRTNLNQTFNTVLIDRGSKENRKLVFRTFDDTGKQLLEDLVPIDENKALQAGITSALAREDLSIMGTWGERNSKQSIGFYFVTIDPFNEQKIKFLDVGQLSHYLDYLSPKRAARIKESSKEDLADGKIPNFTSYVQPYKVMEYEHGYLLLAEVFNPVSNMNPYYSNPYYYNPYYSPYGMNSYYPGYYYPGMGRMYRPYAYGNNTKNVDEIKATESVVVSFDPTGKVQWDHSFKIADVKMSGIEQVSDFHLDGNKLFLLYRKESELKLKSIVLSKDTASESSAKMLVNDPVDEIRSEKEGEGSVRYWTGNSFYVWGYQTVRNVTKEDRVRDVFYIIKVEVH